MSGPLDLQSKSLTQQLEDWASSHHDNGGHDTNRCPACQVLAILEAE